MIYELIEALGQSVQDKPGPVDFLFYSQLAKLLFQACFYLAVVVPLFLLNKHLISLLFLKILPIHLRLVLHTSVHLTHLILPLLLKISIVSHQIEILRNLILVLHR